MLTAELEAPLEEQVVATRRDLHRFPEQGWTEFRTACKVIRTLEALGWTVGYGQSVVAAEARIGVPSEEILRAELDRALTQGADPALAREMAGGFTGVVGTLGSHGSDGVLAIRFDMDANGGYEAQDMGHLPAREAFSSVNLGTQHNCGHDGHTAIGLGLARRLAECSETIAGEVRLIFQPAEEGARGASAMVAAGVLDEVNRFLGCHIGVRSISTGEIIAGYNRLLATTKLDVAFCGASAHAGLAPHLGRNALLAASSAVQNLLAIPRHGDGDSRVNVGSLVSHSPRNTIPGEARLSAEVRGASEEINEYMVRAAERICASAAAMHEVSCVSERVGHTPGASSDLLLVDEIGAIAQTVEGVQDVIHNADFGASDDAATMMREVQKRGGVAGYIGLGANLANGHHTPYFDFDEKVLGIGVTLLCAIVKRWSAELRTDRASRAVSGRHEAPGGETPHEQRGSE